MIPPAPAALVEASFQIPRDGVDVTVANGFVSDQGQNAGASRWTAHGRANEPLTFTWRRRVEDQRATQPLRLRGSVTQLVRPGSKTRRRLRQPCSSKCCRGWLARSLLPCRRARSSTRWRARLVADWGGTDCWWSAGVPGARSGTRRHHHGRRRGAGSEEWSVAVPLFRLPDAERETGGVAVEVLGAGEIVERQPQALEPADALDLGSIVRGRESPSLVAFRFKPLTGHDARALSVRVSRYTTQALVVANVDEARYQVLLTDDGKALVKARYAVRNNHRGLLSVALPSGATLWHASVAHRPVRPGRSTTGALLVPLEKGRSRDDLPPFAVEIVYAAPATPWADKGIAEAVLPALDLPISRTGVELHYSPRFRVTSTSSAFRADVYAAPLSPALRDDENEVAQRFATSARPLEEDVDKDGGAALNALVKQFQQASGGRAVNGVLPIDVPFPRFGAVMFLATELTPETHAPVVQLQYQRARGN